MGLSCTSTALSFVEPWLGHISHLLCGLLQPKEARAKFVIRCPSLSSDDEFSPRDEHEIQVVIERQLQARYERNRNKVRSSAISNMAPISSARAAAACLFRPDGRA